MRRSILSAAERNTFPLHRCRYRGSDCCSQIEGESFNRQDNKTEPETHCFGFGFITFSQMKGFEKSLQKRATVYLFFLIDESFL